MRKPRIVVADDSSKFVSLISRILSQECEIVAEAMGGEQALEATLRLQPDVLLLDISMPRLNGLEVARRLADSGSTVKIIFLTVLEEREYVNAASKLGGAQGYVLKRLIHNDLRSAIFAVLEGKTFYPKGLS